MPIRIGGGSGGLNLGADIDVALATTVTLYPGSGDNLFINLFNSAEWVFTLDASDVTSPTLTVTEQAP
ncbi:hypothetical protein [Paraglaciecola polaris]|uniref:Uncharacterized protein n=1 Tax=Paraglaciecola polaris LMG 21857 TaxID=1129793 RepID=K6YKW6_9ALTE|nr:hypothetical protein [Paraglaciecola polaris]GAC33334.1 hypothetical protein GPLA_2429 [Paraglaciecola polaris LMG 21857]